MPSRLEVPTWLVVVSVPLAVNCLILLGMFAAGYSHDAQTHTWSR